METGDFGWDKIEGKEEARHINAGRGSVYIIGIDVTKVGDNIEISMNDYADSLERINIRD